MELSDFDFELPEDLIALRPVRPRRASRLLVSSRDGVRDRVFSDLAQELAPGDLLIFNDTKVIPARLFGERARDGSVVQVEALLIRRDGPDQWGTLARPGKRLKVGDILTFGALSAEVLEKREGGEVALRFDRSGADLDAAVAGAGEMPLPPYIAGKRPADAQDRSDYQTIFAEKEGAVAAPTASLHFDEALMDALAARDVADARVTLHVGAGTFAPVKADRIEDHRMHAEWGEIGAATVEAIRKAKADGGRVIPVGTTAMRLLETAGQGGLSPFTGETDIFIKPGHRFTVADGLITNFHLPRSTLMMLVAALTGMDRMRAIYAHAVAARYRFYSYGDGSLLWPD